METGSDIARSGLGQDRPGTEFYSFEYVDEEGDLCVRHAFMTVAEVQEAIRRLGPGAKAYRLSGSARQGVPSRDVGQELVFPDRGDE